MDPGSHVGFQISTKNTNLVVDHPMNISGKFGSILFRGEIRMLVHMKEISKKKNKKDFSQHSCTNVFTAVADLQVQCILSSFLYEVCLLAAGLMRTHYGPWQPCWISNQHQKHKSGSGPSSEHFWQVWLISVQRFQRRRFK
jgi:hypothetical protein